MANFNKIQHINRKIYERTFMNEIILFFTYNQIDIDNVREDIVKLLPSENCIVRSPDKDKFIYKFENSIITFTSAGVLISIPSKEYNDFCSTSDIWEHLEKVFKTIGISPMIWSFTKGNRFVFNKPIPENKYDEVYKLVLSENLINDSNENHVFVEESDDKKCVFTCRYGMEKINDKDCLSLKTMIVSQSYIVSDLKKQIIKRNDDMFDCWHWCMSENTLNLMENKQK